MQTVKMEGIVLNRVKFQDYDLIATIFTRDTGILKLFLPHALSRQGKSKSSLEPFVLAEFVVKTNRRELQRCNEVMVINHFRNLRASYSLLECSCHLAEGVLHSQWSGRPAAPVYDLFKLYLSHLQDFSDYKTALSSFYLKILRFEGLLSMEHLPEKFSQEEREIVLVLAYSRSLSVLKTLVVDSTFHSWVHEWFTSAVRE